MTTSFRFSEDELREIVTEHVRKLANNAAATISVTFSYDRPAHPTPTDQGEGTTATAILR